MRGTQGERLSPLIWLNLVCLDAPLVALAWQQLFARSFALHVSIAASLALFATAWLTYLIDRVADARTVASNMPVSRRQRFARSHPMFFGCAIAIAATTGAIAIKSLDPQTLASGARVGALLIVYLAINRFFTKLWRVLPVKELAIGVLFAAGVCASLGRVSAVPLPMASTFATLCALNCVSIAFWERDLDLAQQRSSLATALPSLQPAAALGCVVVAFLAFAYSRQVVAVCIAVSAALLAILNWRHLNATSDARTALADLVLLTPLAALPFAS